MKVEQVFSDRALMIDNETFALGPNAYLTQVGLCVANLRTREYEIPPTNFWMTQAGQEGRIIDVETVAWWVQQKPEISHGVLMVPEGTERTHPDVLFQRIKEIVDKEEGTTVWASPAMFDLAQLTSLWDGRKPWKYNMERDMMTLYKLIDPQGVLAPPENDSAHNAGADAGWQMECLFNLMHHLKYCIRAGEAARALEQEALDRGG